MRKPFVALHLSGGTTDLLRVEGEQIDALGGSMDLHAGQLIDRVGVALGFAFPAGPALEQLALTGAAESRIPVSLEKGDLRCHLSGAETRALQWLRDDVLPRAQIAAEVFDLLARTVSRMLIAACKAADTDQALVVGGVASSMLLRAMLEKRLQKAGAKLTAHFGKPEYSADNAAGVALLGIRRYLAEKNTESEGTFIR